jgi:putative peptide zinc metalloprotease protein
MVASVFSPSWYRVAELRPTIRSHAVIHRQHFRGDLWYVLQDRAAGKYHRLTPAAYYVVGLMDGARNIDEIWQQAVDYLKDDAPTQDEVIGLLGQLHSSDVLRCDVSPDALELFRRYTKKRKAFWKQRFSSPLSIRIPLWDPEKFLAATAPFIRPLFGWFGALLWLIVVGLACVQAGVHWNEISGDFVDKALAPENLLVMFFAYPAVKALHELGHAYATHIWGGEVHELGIMFLVFMPIPYVDASAASSFHDKRKRMLVGAAGILVEAFLASLALFVWLSVEPGNVSAIAYSVMLIGGVSTVLFNGNPLLRFDGYHILGDALEIPNLGNRSNGYLTYLLQRYLLRVPNANSPVTAPGEKFWLPLYGLAAFLYRMLIMIAIIIFVASKFFFVGVLIALWSLFALIVMPLWKAGKFFVSSPVLVHRRGRAAVIGVFTIALLAAFFALFPAPLRTQVEGVVWLPEQAMVRAGASGSVEAVLATPNTQVREGDPLFKLEDPFLPVRVRLFESRLEELRITEALHRENDLVLAQNTREQILEVQENLDRALEQVDKLTIRAPADGVFVVPTDADVLERFLAQGEVVGYILNYKEFLVRVVVPQEHIALVRQQTRGVQLRLAGNVSNVFEAQIERQVPGATDRLPTAALGTLGGGDIAIDPRSEDGVTTFETVFQFDVSLPDDEVVEQVGGRVFVRFDHGTEPLGSQVYRAARRLWLRHFNV